MRIPDSVVIPLLLIAATAGGMSHRRVGSKQEDRYLSAGFAVAAVSIAAVFALLFAGMAWPRWAMRGPLFLAVAVAALGAAAWLWRDKFPRSRKAGR